MEVVEETDVGVGDDAAPDTEVQDAQEPSLEELLSQADAETQEPEPKNTKAKDDSDEDKVGKVLNYFEEQQRQQAIEQLKTDMGKAINTVREAGVALPDNLIEAYLEQQASRDQRVANMWRNRSKNEASFNAMLKAQGKELVKALETKVDRDATNGADAIVSAVQNSSKSTNRPEKSPDFLSMSPDELRKWEDANLR